MADRAPRNFIISYVARVGSSALVDTLARLPSVVVPVFEELDWYEIERRGLAGTLNADTIHAEVHRIFADRRAAHPGCAVGFKWRMFGRPRELARVLRDHDVVLFNLVRAGLLELASSRYLTHIAYHDNDAPQFAYADSKDEAARDELLHRYRAQRVTADIPGLIALSDAYVEEEKRRMGLLEELQAEGVPVYTILYEDFAYQRLHFLTEMLHLLGLPELRSFPLTRLTKISHADPTELFSNRADLLASPEMFTRARAWERMVFESRFPVVCG